MLTRNNNRKKVYLYTAALSPSFPEGGIKADYENLLFVYKDDINRKANRGDFRK